MLELMNAIDAGEDGSQIQNLWFSKNGTVIKNPLRDLIQDFDPLPLPLPGDLLQIPLYQGPAHQTVYLRRGMPLSLHLLPQPAAEKNL